jgi:ketosteroid isomerase-like protein
MPVEPETTLEMSDLKVRVYGDTGVATGTSKASWVSDGVRTTDQDRFIDVFAKRKGKWYLVAGQTTRISREQQPVKK